MSIISIHSPETAPEASRPFLEKSKERFGFSPNILGALAESPAALEGYISLATLFGDDWADDADDQEDSGEDWLHSEQVGR